ncbi:MAG: hypothetical protein IMZ61_00235 [Planctomycetes bacterium]|nr:hypothetical protein [Thermoplasmata archaeon]MBE3142345.1 hypothetical protein [Planctomycetota bacterium]
MRVSDVRKKYPEFFATVEAAVWYDIREINLKKGSDKKYNPLHIHDKDARRIAYNASAVATLELHKAIKAKK